MPNPKEAAWKVQRLQIPGTSAPSLSLEGISKLWPRLSEKSVHRALDNPHQPVMGVIL